MKTEKTKRGKGKPGRTPEEILNDKQFAEFIGSIVEKKREELGFSEREMAEKLDVCASAYNQIKHGFTAVSHTRAARIFKAIGVRYCILVGEGQQFIF